MTVEATASPAKLRKHASEFEKAWVNFGRNFLALGEKVIAAADDGVSVDDLIGETGLTAARSTAYAAAKATRLWRVFEPFASPARIVLDCESQFRDFPADLELDSREARKIVKLIERDIEPDKRGQHRPTREQLKPIIAATVGLRGFGPEKRKPQAAAESRLPEATAEPPMRTSTAEPPRPGVPDAPALDTSPGMFGRGPHLTEDREEILLPVKAAAIDGSSVDEWNGQPNPYAQQLHYVNNMVRALLAQHLGEGDKPFRKALARLLLQLELDIEADANPAGGTGQERSKGGCMLDGRTHREMPKAARRAK